MRAYVSSILILHAIAIIIIIIIVSLSLSFTSTLLYASILLVNIFSFHATVLVFIFRHSPIVIGLLSLTEHVRKLDIVGDDDELEVFLFSSRVHDIDQRAS